MQNWGKSQVNLRNSHAVLIHSLTFLPGLYPHDQDGLAIFGYHMYITSRKKLKQGELYHIRRFKSLPYLSNLCSGLNRDTIVRKL